MKPLVSRTFLHRALLAGALSTLFFACGGDKVNGLVPVLAARDGSPVDASGKADYLVDFGEVPVGGQGSRSFYVRNKGRSVMTLQPLTVAAPFTTELTATRGVPAQEELGIVFGFSPTDEGAAQTVVTVASDGGSVTVLLAGKGRKALPTDCLFDVAPLRVDFGAVGAGRTKTADFRIVNKGSNVCTVTHLVLSSGSDPGFSLVGGAVATVDVNPFDDLTVTVQFKPLRFATSFAGAVQFSVGPPATAREVALVASSPEPCPGALADGSCPAAAESTYVNDADTLYTWDPASNLLRPIGSFTVNGRSVGGMTDIAIDHNGTMIGCAMDKKLYVINPTTAACGYLSTMDEAAKGLTFLPDGRLVASGVGVWAIDRTTGHKTATIVPAGRYTTSGDIIGLPDGNLYWAVSGTGNDQLVRIDPAAGTTSLIGTFSASEVYGLAYANGDLYCYTASGKALTVDPATAQSSQTRTLPGTWWGATTNPVTWAQ